MEPLSQVKSHLAVIKNEKPRQESRNYYIYNIKYKLYYNNTLLSLDSVDTLREVIILFSLFHCFFGSLFLG